MAGIVRHTMAFCGKVALVTGGSRGIGKAVAVMLAREGASVGIVYQSRHEEAEQVLEQLQQETAATNRSDNTKHCKVAGNVASPEDTKNIADSVRASLGPIDLLVHCAGIADPCEPGDLHFSRWKKTMDVNLDGTFNMVFAVKDEMISRKYGRIVTIASVAALRQRAWNMAYSVSKAAVIQFTKCCAEAFGGAGVRVNSIAPGVIDTDMIQGEGEDGAKAHAKLMSMAKEQSLSSRGVGAPEEVAAAAKFLLSDESSFMTGQTMVVDGGRMMIP